MRQTTEAIAAWWRRYGGVMVDVPNALLDELDALIRADERAKQGLYGPTPRVISHTSVERNDGSFYEVITWDDGTMAYWSEEARDWRPANKYPKYHDIVQAREAERHRHYDTIEEPNGPHD